MVKPQPIEEPELAETRNTGTVTWRALVAALLGAMSVGMVWLLVELASANPRPIQEGYGVGAITVREKDYVTELKCHGCKVECFDQFVVVHLDKSKEPTWTDNYIKVIPWEKIEYMTLLPYDPVQ